MSTFHLHNKPWARNHDPHGSPLRPSVPQITGFDTLADLLEICATRPANTKFKASGSHWGLSEAAVSDDEPIRDQLARRRERRAAQRLRFSISTTSAPTPSSTTSCRTRLAEPRP